MHLVRDISARGNIKQDSPDAPDVVEGFLFALKRRAERVQPAGRVRGGTVYAGSHRETERLENVGLLLRELPLLDELELREAIFAVRHGAGRCAGAWTAGSVENESNHGCLVVGSEKSEGMGGLLEVES